MAEPYIDLGGIIIPESALKLRRAREVVQAVRARHSAFTSLVECRKLPGVEMVILDVEPSRPQILANPIERVERVAAVFHEQDNVYPEVLSLRPNFPLVLHLNQQAVDYPRSFCLYDRPWSEIRVNWTGSTFVERIRWWLAGTARGNLHEDDQPLEPLLLAAGLWLVVPTELPAPMTPCAVFFADNATKNVLLVSEVLPHMRDKARAPHILLRFESPPRHHGTSPQAPKTLADLCQLLTMPGFDLLTLLRQTLKNWPKDHEADLNATVVLLIDLPKVKTSGGDVAAFDRKAFLTTFNVLALGAAVGAWTLSGKTRSLLLQPDAAKVGNDVPIAVTNVTNMLTADAAAVHNGAKKADPSRILAVGAGALGSQVILNLCRAGFGQWTIMDEDHVLPHNLARHALDGGSIGFPKAAALTDTVNSLFSSNVATAISADILEPSEQAAAVSGALGSANIILDMAASVPVARRLADAASNGRRMSVFLSPSGHDLVLLCEDQTRQITIDKLEMTYYAAVATDQRLDKHLDASVGRKRYGLSCRDVASRIAQADVGMFSGIAARAIPDAASRIGATIRVWRSEPNTGAVTVVDIPFDSWHTRALGEWTVHIADRVRDQTARWRLERLANETGGIIVGGIDHDRRRIYATFALSSPADSEEKPTRYVRGIEGMRRKADEIIERTAGNMVYLGEWHSHPKGSPTAPSSDDLNVLKTVTDWVAPAGQPGMIMIAGDGDRARLILEGLDAAILSEEVCPA